jgi:addiction module RelB/DinJ family antitoxin
MKTVISVKTDLVTKEAAQEVVKAAGLNLSTVINAYLRQLAATRRIEFYAPEQMSPRLESLIGEVEAEIAAGKVSKSHKKAGAFLADLKS